jgi:hypothetical protein
VKILVQVGFEPKLTFLCPLCNKEVEIVYERANNEWVSEHAGCLNFTVVRTLPRIGNDDLAGSLVFLGLESDFSIKEAVEGLRLIAKDEPDQQKRQKIDSGIKKIESKIGSAEKNVMPLADILKAGAFGLKVVAGREVYALVWKYGERYYGQAMNADIKGRTMLATDSLDEALRYVSYWLGYWGHERILK